MKFDLEKNFTLIDDDKVSCEGKDSFDSHPRIYLDLSSGQIVTCPYCNAKFKKK